MEILELCRQELEYAVRIRRHLHAYPEPTSYEFRTVEYIASQLEELGIPFTKIKDGGVIAEVDSGKQGKTVLLRADCDALRMQESPENAKKKKVCVSQVPGVAHMCGHDSHVAMLLAAGRILNEHKEMFTGRVLLLFERGEEGGMNIYYVMKYLQENRISIDSCWSNHVSPDFPAGVVAIAEGPSNAALFNFEVTLTGKGGHGSRPDRANNPIHCFSAILERLNDYRMRCSSPFEPLTFDICSVHAGTASNVIPETLEFAGTCRYFDRKLGIDFKEYLKKTINTCCEFYECSVQYRQFSELCIPTISNPQCAGLASEAAARILGKENVRPREPRMGSESFSILTAYYPSARGIIGIRNEQEGIICNNHHPGFEIDEKGMIYGILMNVIYAVTFLKSDISISYEPFRGDIDCLFQSMNTEPPARHDSDM